ncbi:SDR family NAD(P)-dependent oxidoreductase [Lacisediminihabitans profunda]|uniref:SDR family oxidoreductase n=1 Tax=Lacisediminihabitans profunda TaxID=2594790 RepID=A0A5C8UNC4_9MICO|nr:SDR family oxidoreductase [Lacisediminihabitans profunda]TXN29368.1 SDR family oxidoreductase [Lacisediminihabitans profunda]
MSDRTIVVIGGTSGIGLEIARDVVARGDRVVLSGRDLARAQEVASSLGERATGVAIDLSRPEGIRAGLATVGTVNGLVLVAIERDANTVRDYDIARATQLVVLKLVGYTEVIHTLIDRLEPSGETGIVLFGGRAKDIPYPGSTTVSTINGGVEGMTTTLALELAPIRVNALHPGIIGDSPFWAGKPAAVLDGHRSRTPGHQLATMVDVVDATQFLLRNRGISGTSIYVDRGVRVT